MKIVFCLHHFLPDFIGGTEMYTYSLAKELLLGGNEVCILVPHFDSTEFEIYYYDEIKVIMYPENSVEDRQMIMGKSRPLGLQAYANILSKEKPDIIHFHELAPGRGVNIYHVEKAKELGFKVILSFHLSYYTCIKGSLVYKDEIKCDGIINLRKCSDCLYQERKISGLKSSLLLNGAMGFYRLGVDTTKWNNTVGTALGIPVVINNLKNDLFKLSTFANAIIVLTDWYKNILVKNGIPKQKLILIRQGLTFKNALLLENTRYNLAYPLRLVFIGRIIHFKGLHLLIEAMNNMPEDVVTLTIYGREYGDEYNKECRAKSAQKKNIIWGGALDADKVQKKLPTFDVLCLPSTFSEMSPLVIQEAFAAGIPVLASDVYGNAEQIVNGQNGWLFQFKDAVDLKNKLCMLCNDLALVEKAKKNLPKTKSFVEVANEHMDVYLKVLKD